MLGEQFSHSPLGPYSQPFPYEQSPSSLRPLWGSAKPEVVRYRPVGCHSAPQYLCEWEQSHRWYRWRVFNQHPTQWSCREEQDGVREIHPSEDPLQAERGGFQCSRTIRERVLAEPRAEAEPGVCCRKTTLPIWLTDQHGGAVGKFSEDRKEGGQATFSDNVSKVSQQFKHFSYLILVRLFCFYIVFESWDLFEIFVVLISQKYECSFLLVINTYIQYIYIYNILDFLF